MTENNEVPEIERKSSKGKIFLTILFLILILCVVTYFEYGEEINAKIKGIPINKNLDEICFNETHLINYQSNIAFYMINESFYCNLIPISWTDINNQTYSTELISINCLKGGNS